MILSINVIIKGVYTNKCLNKSPLLVVGYCWDDIFTFRFEYKDPASITSILSNYFSIFLSI